MKKEKGIERRTHLELGEELVGLVLGCVEVRFRRLLDLCDVLSGDLVSEQSRLWLWSLLLLIDIAMPFSRIDSRPVT